MNTARDIIKGSLRLLGVLASGEDPSSSELSDGLGSLNELVESWSNENLMVYADTEETLPLVGGQQSYSMGVGGDFDTVRPLNIYRARLQVTSQNPSYDLPLEIINLEQWSGTILKTTTSTYPTSLYIDDNYPLCNLKFWPIPSQIENVVLHSQKPLTSFANGSDTVLLPPGYIRALKYNLAIDLAPEFGKEASMTVATVASESKASIKRLNIKPHYLKSDAANLTNARPFNWLTGE